MGQEWAASSPFLYFTDHEGEFGREVSAGRRREFGWPENDLEHVPDPQAEATFQASKLNWDEIAGEPHRGMLNLYKELLGLRRVVLRKGAVRREHWAVEATGDAVALRYDLPDFHWLVLAALAPGPPPADLSAEILRPPPGRRWAPRLSSEARQFGGTEMRAPMPAKFPGPGAVLYEARTEESHAAH